jgi:hypothetical protein
MPGRGGRVYFASSDDISEVRLTWDRLGRCRAGVQLTNCSDVGVQAEGETGDRGDCGTSSKR